MTAECLDSLGRIDYPNYQILVVDNGSTDGSQELIKNKFPSVILMENESNLGFVEGNNRGINYAIENKADYIFLVNDDVVVSPSVLSTLVDIAENDRKVGILGPMIYHYDEPNRIQSAGGKIHWGKGRASHQGWDEIDYRQYNGNRDVDFLFGCAFLIKRSVIKKIGLMDPAFFMYFEEADWCFRAKKAGYKVVCVADSKVWHHNVNRENSPVFVYYFTRNNLLFMKKNASWHTWTCFLPYFLFNSILKKIGKWMIKGEKDKREKTYALLKALVDFWLKRYEGRF